MTGTTLTYSSELMQNYLQAELMAPEGPFHALQSSTGLGLLFSLSSAGVLNLAQEQSATASGWLLNDLSSAQIAKDFSGQSGVVVKSFSTAQNAADATIRLAMAINDTKQDHLYLSLGNSASDLSWISAPAWTSYPFDNPNTNPGTVQIVEVWLSNAADAAYIMVDIQRQPGSQIELVSRYYIDPTKANGYAWVQHDLPIDLQADLYQTCPGRQAGSYSVEGLYTSGHVNGSPQFVFTPLYNAFDLNAAPSPARLTLPNGLTADALASCRNTDNSTDLYVAAQGGLYYFASTNQHDQATGILLQSSPLFNGVRDLFACMDEGSVVVWGLNGSDQVFYTSCQPGQQTTTGSWSLPLPILTGMDLISPYLNLDNNANVFFTSDGNNLFRLTQSPDTTLWTQQSITLPPSSTQTPAQNFSSYTTRLQLTDCNNQPVTNTAIQICASTRAPFFINGLYYVLGSEPASIDTDTVGSITLIEASNGLSGTHLTISSGSPTALTINPMAQPMNKLFQLNSASSLQNAQIVSPDGTSRSLVPSGTSSDNLNTVAQSISALQTAQNSLTAAPALQATSSAARPQILRGSSIGDAITTDLGSLLKWLETGVDNVVDIVKDDAEDVWRFVATIAGQAYEAVLDCAEKIAAAAVWVFNAIKVAIEDLILFLEFLFDWQSITRTQQVLKNLIQLWVSDQISSIGQMEQDVDGAIQGLITQIDTLAGITDWSGLGSPAQAPLNASSTPATGLTAPSTYLMYHYHHNASNLKQTNPPPAPNPGDSAVQTLMTALQSEATVLAGTIGQLQTLADNATSMTLSQILEQILVIITDDALNSTEVVANAVLGLLQDSATSAFAVLSTPVYIPVVSDILSFFGVSMPSMLDMFCWITAVAATLEYEIAHGTAPFPDNSDTSFLINATSWSDVVTAFTGSPASASVAAPAALVLAAAQACEPVQNTATCNSVVPTLSAGVADVVFRVGHACAGFFTLMACFTDTPEASSDTGDNSFAIPSAIVNILAGVSDGVAVVLAPQDPIQSTAVNVINRITLGIRILSKLIFSGPAQKRFAASSGIMSNLAVGDGRATGAIVDSILVIPALGCSAWHFYELSKETDCQTRTNAILEETANLSGYISRIGYCIAVNTDVPEVKAGGIVAMDAANVIYMGLETAESFSGMGN